MQAIWLNQQTDNTAVVIYVLGWAADDSLLSHIIPHHVQQKQDVLCLFHWQPPVELPTNLPRVLKSYKQRHLIAWSFGVCMAEYLLHGVTFTQATAINGTPYPVHRQWGIHPRAVALTAHGVAANGMAPFYKKAWGVHYPTWQETLSVLAGRHTKAEFAQELLLLQDLSLLDFPHTIAWTQILAGDADTIFPPVAMKAYWQQKCSVVTEMPHFPFNALIIP